MAAFGSAFPRVAGPGYRTTFTTSDELADKRSFPTVGKMLVTSVQNAVDRTNRTTHHKSRTIASFGAVRLPLGTHRLRATIADASRVIGFPGWLPIAAIVFYLTFAAQAAAQEIGKLYAARPPAGYAFVRVAIADISAGTANVQIASRQAPFENGSFATRYRAVKADKPISLSVDGSVVDERIVPPADQFSTVVVERDGPRWRAYVIEEGQSNSSDLKAQLRFFNLVSRCQASLKIADGPVIFDITAVKNVRARAINPVPARLEASCGEQNATFTLPQLRAGDHFSLFVREAAGGKLSLSGQFDETEPYKDQ